MDSALGNIFMVLRTIMDFIFPVPPTIVVMSYNEPPYPPVADLDPMGIIPTPIINHLLGASPLDLLSLNLSCANRMIHLQFVCSSRCTCMHRLLATTARAVSLLL